MRRVAPLRPRGRARAGWLGGGLVRGLAGLALWAGPAAAGDFMDTTITFVAGDDNVLAGAGETIPSSPDADLRPRPGNSLFYDNYDTRNTGEETRTYLVLSKAFEGYVPRLTPEASMVLQFDLNRMSTDNAAYEDTGSRKTPGGVRDDGSWLALRYGLGKSDGGADRRVSVVLFPFDSDRLRLGYSWEISWGGRSSFILARQVPALQVSYEHGASYAFLAGKTARTQTFTVEPDDPDRDENEAIYAAMGGGGLSLIEDHLLVEVGGGYFQKGGIPIERGTLQGTPIDQYGVSAQVTWTEGIKPTRSVDTKLYLNKGELPLKVKDFGDRKLAWLVSAEATLTSQVLEDAEALGASKRESGYAGDVNGRLETGRWALSSDLVVRSLSFLVQDTPGLFPFATLPEELDVTPEVFFAIGADYRVPDLRLVPGLSLGVQSPAVAKVKATDLDGRPYEANLIVRKTKNVLGQTFVEPTPLPPGEPAHLVYSGRVSVTSHLSDLLMVLGEVQVSWNENLVSNDPEEGTRTFDNPVVLGLQLLAQARF